MISFIINLESRPDRKKQIPNEMIKQNINENKYEIFNAIRPSKKKFSWNNIYWDYVKKMYILKILMVTKKSFRMFESHVGKFNLFIKGYKNVLILEDDTESYIDN